MSSFGATPARIRIDHLPDGTGRGRLACRAGLIGCLDPMISEPTDGEVLVECFDGPRLYRPQIRMPSAEHRGSGDHVWKPCSRDDRAAWLGGHAQNCSTYDAARGRMPSRQARKGRSRRGEARGTVSGVEAIRLAELPVPQERERKQGCCQGDDHSEFAGLAELASACGCLPPPFFFRHSRAVAEARPLRQLPRSRVQNAMLSYTRQVSMARLRSATQHNTIP